MGDFRHRPTSSAGGPNLGSDYTDEEREFLAAVQEYKRRTGRVFLDWTEVLAVAYSLGYRRVAEPTAPPRP